MAETVNRDDAQALIDAGRLATSRDAAAAAHLLTRSLEFLAVDDPLRKEVVLELIPLATWGGRARQAETLARDELPSADPERDAILRMHLAEAIGMQDRWSEAATMWAELHDDAAVSDRVRLRARAERASALAFCRDIGRARAIAQEVLSESKSSRDETARFLALHSLGACLFFEGRCEEAVSIAEELVEIADASDDVRLSWRNPRLFYGVALTAAGQLAQASSVLHDGRELARRTGALWAMPAYQCYIALLSYREGRWKDAVAECEEGLRLCEASDATMELATDA
ncbi:MAG TPA: hypothetical protein VG408_00065, partial [Actinomycetota bacterium]|nr:hypothetical protein [Actinomycetota bacterium]